ncbi:nicotinamidase-like [Glandiceps talaboti]
MKVFILSFVLLGLYISRCVATCNNSPVTALLVIDVQNDFINGSLALKHSPANQDGYEVVPVINKLLEDIKFDVVVYSKDWHPANHISFYDNLNLRPLHSSSQISAGDAQMFDVVTFAGPPVMEQTLWPTHCIQESWGSEYHKDLTVLDNRVEILKGTNPDLDSYSAFWDNKKLSETTLEGALKNRSVTDVYVCGLAYDYCVGSTAIDAADYGFRTVVIEDAARGVADVTIAAMKIRMTEAGVTFVNANDVNAEMETCGASYLTYSTRMGFVLLLAWLLSVYV